MRTYRPLPAQTLSGYVTFARPDPPAAITVNSLALEVMTDLNRVHAAVIEPQVTIEAANQYMIQRGVRLLLVLGHDKSMTGLITANDIHGPKPMRFVQDRGIKHSEILVSDVMTPLERVEAFPMDDVRQAKVGHIVASLKSTGRHHALAMERDASGHITVRGIFSLSQIARQLGVAIHTTEVAKNFAEIEAVLMADAAMG